MLSRECDKGVTIAEKYRSFFTKEKYEVELFREKGFVRKKCKVCGNYFWTLDPDRETCGDTNCVMGYKFVGRRGPNWDFHQTIDKWCEFFEKHGHTRIKEYPVVARWRDDIAFTIASIADFQPWVVSGVVDPPANPLVVPQPCLRFGGKGFNDIDNVGKTGRHFSLFIMGGQHAFNSKKWKSYWMDECIDLNFKFLTEYLKIPPDEITYREDVWSGGGNLGPCLEAFAYGLEIVNNVFMQYEVLPDGSIKEMENKIIDVGWGIERICWFSQGTITAYDAVFGPVLEWLKKETGVKEDLSLLKRYVEASCLLDSSEISVADRDKIVAERIGVPYEELQQSLGPIHALYAIADHTRALLFAIADGAIPSNVGGGYNLRVLLRRSLSLNDLYGLDIDFIELFYRHMEYLKRSYPRVLEAEGIIEDIFKVERQRYYETLSKGRSYVERLLKRKRELKKEDLIELYESRGIPPELVQKVASGLGIKVTIPSDFYVSLSEKVSKREVGQKEEITEALANKVKDLPPTRELFYEDPYLIEFRAKVLRIINNRYIVLDKTCFYPTGGGQLHDTGFIGNTRVINVERVGTVIVHEVEDTTTLNEGMEVICKIDADRRRSLMRHHTATHIINEAARRVLGKHVWQAGAEKRPEKARLDITHYKPLTPEEVREIEYLANKIVMENRPVEIEYLERTIAEQKYGFRIYQGGAAPGRVLRIVKIHDWDVEACGGTHCSTTGEVGLIKILRVERIQDGVVRIEFCAGEEAIKQMQNELLLLEKAAQVLRVPKEQLPDAVNRFFNEWKERGKTIEKLMEELAEVRADALISSGEKLNNVLLVAGVLGVGREELVKITEKIINREPSSIVALGGGTENATVVLGFGERVCQLFDNAKKLTNELCKKTIGGGAGGKPPLIVGGGPKRESLERLIEVLKIELKRLLSEQTFPE